MNVSATLDAVADWPVDEQLDLVFGLWDRIVDAGWRPESDAALIEEFQRRLKAHDAVPSRALTWEQVVARVKRAK